MPGSYPVESSSSNEGAEGDLAARTKRMFGPMETVLRLDPAITDRVHAAVLSADGIVVRAEDPQVWEAVERVAAASRARWTGKAPGEIPELQPARELYRR